MCTLHCLLINDQFHYQFTVSATGSTVEYYDFCLRCCQLTVKYTLTTHWLIGWLVDWWVVTTHRTEWNNHKICRTPDLWCPIVHAVGIRATQGLKWAGARRAQPRHLTFGPCHLCEAKCPGGPGPRHLILGPRPSEKRHKCKYRILAHITRYKQQIHAIACNTLLRTI